MDFTGLTREQLETAAKSLETNISHLDSSIESLGSQLDAKEHTIQTQGDIIRNQLTELELLKNKPLEESYPLPHDIIFHQQNNPSNIAPSHLACGKKIDQENVPVFEREKVTCKTCLSKADPHIRY